MCGYAYDARCKLCRRAARCADCGRWTKAPMWRILPDRKDRCEDCARTFKAQLAPVTERPQGELFR